MLYTWIRVSIAVLGSLATLVASFLAHMRGSSEPENPFLRGQALSNFIRKLDAFILDHGSESGSDYDKSAENFARNSSDCWFIRPEWKKKPPSLRPGNKNRVRGTSLSRSRVLRFQQFS
jgi:hypothetical protein